MTQPAKLSPYVNPLKRLEQIDDTNIHKSSISKNLIQYSTFNRVIEWISNALGFSDFQLESVLKSLETVLVWYDNQVISEEGVKTLKTKMPAIYDALKPQNSDQENAVKKSKLIFEFVIKKMDERLQG